MLIEDKFGGGSIRTNSSVYAMPRQVVKGDRLTAAGADRAPAARRIYAKIRTNKIGYLSADWRKESSSPRVPNRISSRILL